MQKIALVTGASDRIGRQIALQLAQDGFRVIVHYLRNKQGAEQTVQLIEQANGKADAIQADLTKLEQVQALQQHVQTIGPLTCIVHNAGFAQLKSFFDYAPNEWQIEIDACLTSTIHLAYVFLPEMKQTGGRFIPIIGDSARTGDRKLIISAAARGGVLSFIKSLSKEVGRDQICCNVVSLGLIDQQDLPEHVAQKITKAYPIGRLGTTNDVSGIVSFLASETSGWITGQTFSVNGGHTSF